MHTHAVVAAVVMMCLGCLSTARYDRAHLQRVAQIHARYEGAIQREHQHYLSRLAELESRRAFVIPVIPARPETMSAPLHRIDQRDDIVECRRRCASRRHRDADPSPTRSQAVPCVRDICQSYIDALVETYAAADFAWVIGQLASTADTDIESLLALSHNQSLAASIDEQAKELARRQAQTRSHLEQQRGRELSASAQLRDSEIATARQARRARVKAAADALAPANHGRSLLPPGSHLGPIEPPRRPPAESFRRSPVESSAPPAAASIEHPPVESSEPSPVDSTGPSPVDSSGRPPVESPEWLREGPPSLPLTMCRARAQPR